MTEHNLFQEVEADLERQKLEDLWKRYGGWVVSLAVAIVIATAGMTAWHSWTTERNQTATAGLTEAIEKAQADPSREIDTLEAFAGQTKGHTQATFARLHAASLSAEKGDKDKAVQIYDSVAADTSADTAFRQLADLMAVRTLLDTGNPADLQKRLQPLMGENAPWRFSAMEYSGYLSLRAGEKAGAVKIFTDLSQNASTPQTIAGRAADMLRYISE